MGDFRIYQGTGEPDSDSDRIRQLGTPPPWRTFDGGPITPLDRESTAGWRPQHLTRARAYRADAETVKMVNVALHLRRPLLVTGDPGNGKSALAYAVAHELRLGPVLHWPITSRSTLDQGLYHYDAVARIEEASLAQQAAAGAVGRLSGQPDTRPRPEDDVGRFVRLGPLGTALVPYETPRVLLIDEIDKCDVDLPNDLLSVFEEGEFEIRELRRNADTRREARVFSSDVDGEVTVREGRLGCRVFPLVIMTSNGERDFPPAFLRRCVQLTLTQPDQDRIQSIVQEHLGVDLAAEAANLINEYVNLRSEGQRATDQLLNAVYLLHQARGGSGLTFQELVDVCLHDLDPSA